MNIRVRRGFAPLVFYLLIACIALSPLLFRATTHTGGEWTTDYYHFHWNYWWIRHALATPGLNVYETNFVLFPFSTNLALHTLTPFWFPAWASLEPLFGGGHPGTLLAMNVIMVIAMTLTGRVFYGLLRREGVADALALPFGVALQICSGMMLAAMLTTINYLSGFWLPLNLLTWGEIVRAAGRRRFIFAGLLGIAFYGTALTDLQHLLFLSLLIVPYGVWGVVTQPGWRGRFELLAASALSLGIMTVLLWVAGPLPALLSYDFASLSPQPITNAASIAFPDGFLSRFGTFDREITLGALILPLVALGAAAAVWRRNRTHPAEAVRRASPWFWLALMIAPLLLAAGPTVMLFGTQFDAPYTPLHRIFGGLFRSPARFDAAIIVAALLFAGKALTPLIRRVKLHPSLIAAPLLILVIADAHLFAPMPVQPVTRDYAAYHTIGAERGPGYDDLVVLEVPVAGGSGEAWVGEFKPMEAQFYGMVHGKRMLNGAVARAPLSHFWYWLYDDPMLAWLGQRRFLEPEAVEAQLRERLQTWKLGYIVVHGDWIGLDGPTFQEIVGYLNGLRDLVCPFAIEDEVVFYRTIAHPAGCPARTPPRTDSGDYRIDVGSPEDLAFTGWGWHRAETIFETTLRWAGEYPQAALYLDLPPGDYAVEIAAQAFHEARTLRLRVNGALLDESVLVSVDSLGTYAFTLPAGVVGSGAPLNLELIYEGWTVPGDIGLGEDRRRLAVAVDWIRFVPR
ncbi:MAG: hypothetical protein JNL42_07215 [Anaerolineae bacterium]|nr:hypothetical protein [Anaerolineae bacterium]